MDTVAPTVWRLLILIATLFCVVMLFAPLVRELLAPAGDLGPGLP